MAGYQWTNWAGLGCPINGLEVYILGVEENYGSELSSSLVCARSGHIHALAGYDHQSITVHCHAIVCHDPYVQYCTVPVQ